MTGLPIIETKAGDVSAYIPTNVISITDGQIYLQADLFNANVRPAIDVGVSVSRVGGAAQIKAMKSVAGRLKLDLAQYRALEAFAMFASDLDPASRAQLAKGARLVELLKQRQASPYPVEEQVVSIWLGTTGKLDDVAVEDVRRFEADFLDHLRRSKNELLAAIRETGKFEEETEQALESEVDHLQAQPSRAPVPTASRPARRPRTTRPRRRRSPSRSRSSSRSADRATDDQADLRKAETYGSADPGVPATASVPSARPRRSPGRWSSWPLPASSRRRRRCASRARTPAR